MREIPTHHSAMWVSPKMSCPRNACPEIHKTSHKFLRIYYFCLEDDLILFDDQSSNYSVTTCQLICNCNLVLVNIAIILFFPTLSIFYCLLSLVYCSLHVGWSVVNVALLFKYRILSISVVINNSSRHSRRR